MSKLILTACALIAANHLNVIDLNAIPHLGDYLKVLLISLVLMPWVTGQLDG